MTRTIARVAPTQIYPIPPSFLFHLISEVFLCILDLTHCISPEMPVYPGTEQPVLTTACTIREAGYRETILHMYSHTGTHMDAPAHMIDGGRTLDAFPAETFVGPGFVLDCRGLREIPLSLLRAHEDEDTPGGLSALLHRLG